MSELSKVLGASCVDLQCKTILKLCFPRVMLLYSVHTVYLRGADFRIIRIRALVTALLPLTPVPAGRVSFALAQNPSLGVSLPASSVPLVVLAFRQKGSAADNSAQAGSVL